jgi:CubicO group peptidase (beta-lactamase class C family)
MILQMVEERKITLETTLGDFFPQVPNAKMITIQQMLSHRSGIRDFTHSGDEGATVPDGRNQQAMILRISKFKPDFQPGEKFEYSNSNFLLLGYIIEKLDALPFGKALKNRITSKVPLPNTYYGKVTLDSVENKSHAYRLENNKWTFVDEGDFSVSVPGAAGSIVSTPTDMVRFIEALFTGVLISKASLAKMTDIKEFYGLGMFVFNSQWSKGFGHGGGYIASHATLVYHPNDSLAIAYCTNGHAYSMNSIISHVLNICHDKSYVLPFTKKAVDLSKDILLKYTGAYQTEKFLLEVELENNHLVIAPAGQPKSTFYAATENRFFSTEQNIEIAFISNADGKVSAWIFQGDRRMEGKKVK